MARRAGVEPACVQLRFSAFVVRPDTGALMAEELGIEPRLRRPKLRVLPLDDSSSVLKHLAEGLGLEPRFLRPERSVLPLDEPSAKGSPADMSDHLLSFSLSHLSSRFLIVV